MTRVVIRATSVIRKDEKIKNEVEFQFLSESVIRRMDITEHKISDVEDRVALSAFREKRRR